MTRMTGPDQEFLFSNGFTYSAHPVCCAAALKNIEIIEREGVLEHVRAHVWMCGMSEAVERDGGEKGRGRCPLGVLAPPSGAEGLRTRRLTPLVYPCDRGITGRPALVSIV